MIIEGNTMDIYEVSNSVKLVGKFENNMIKAHRKGG